MVSCFYIAVRFLSSSMLVYAGEVEGYPPPYNDYINYNFFLTVTLYFHCLWWVALMRVSFPSDCDEQYLFCKSSMLLEGNSWEISWNYFPIIWYNFPRPLTYYIIGIYISCFNYLTCSLIVYAYVHSRILKLTCEERIRSRWQCQRWQWDRSACILVGVITFQMCYSVTLLGNLQMLVGGNLQEQCRLNKIRKKLQNIYGGFYLSKYYVVSLLDPLFFFVVLSF